MTGGVLVAGEGQREGWRKGGQLEQGQVSGSHDSFSSPRTVRRLLPQNPPTSIPLTQDLRSASGQAKGFLKQSNRTNAETPWLLCERTQPSFPHPSPHSPDPRGAPGTRFSGKIKAGMWPPIPAQLSLRLWISVTKRVTVIHRK